MSEGVEKDAPDEGCTCAEIAAVAGARLSDSTISGRYVVGYFCHKGNGHFEMYHDPEAEMACGSSFIPISMDAEAAAWLEEYDRLPPGRWENEDERKPRE